jgi:hypothetical protein
MSLQDYAAEVAANFARWTSFGLHMDVPEKYDWGCYTIQYTSHRDSCLITKANEVAVAEIMDPYITEDLEDEDDWQVSSFSSHHWGFGHVDGFMIRIFTKKGWDWIVEQGNRMASCTKYWAPKVFGKEEVDALYDWEEETDLFTEAFTDYYEQVHVPLESYPLLDECLLSEMELEAETDWWSQDNPFKDHVELSEWMHGQMWGSGKSSDHMSDGTPYWDDDDIWEVAFDVLSESIAAMRKQLGTLSEEEEEDLDLDEVFKGLVDWWTLDCAVVSFSEHSAAGELKDCTITWEDADVQSAWEKFIADNCR